MGRGGQAQEEASEERGFAAMRARCQDTVLGEVN